LSVEKADTRHRRSAHARDLPSLLWPPDFPLEAGSAARLTPETTNDLDLKPISQALSGHDEHRERFVAGVLTELCTDPKVITHRQQVIANLLDEPALCERLRDLLPQLSALVRQPQRPMYTYEWDVEQIVHRLAELELYVEVALRLAEALETSALHAPALQALHASIQGITTSHEFEALREELPPLRAQLDAVQSVTIGVNLSRDLRPESATILSIDAERIEGRGGLLKRLLGQESARLGITKLRGEPGRSLRSFFPPMEPDGHRHANPLVEDLRRLLERVMEPVAKAIERYVWVHTRDFAALENELSLMLNGVALIARLRAAGLPMCRPEIAPMDDRMSALEEGYNPSLALRMLQAAPEESATGSVVTNPITFDQVNGRVWILTGPNRGGKTTYARAAGLAQLLFQAGMYVPARTARISPADKLFTHFPRPESATLGEGRLDDEAVRLAGIFQEATPHSLILINEGLSGTNTLEALGLAHDAVRGLHLLGARTIYVTHLHELARHVDEINDTTCGDGTVGSLVAEVEGEIRAGGAGHRRTFRVRPSPPHGLSYASEIAEQHGISYSQLVLLLRERGLIPDG
jgi:DNA mismatch repair protein MutS